MNIDFNKMVEEATQATMANIDRIRVEDPEKYETIRDGFKLNSKQEAIEKAFAGEDMKHIGYILALGASKFSHAVDKINAREIVLNFTAKAAETTDEKIDANDIIEYIVERVKSL